MVKFLKYFGQISLRFWSKFSNMLVKIKDFDRTLVIFFKDFARNL